MYTQLLTNIFSGVDALLCDDTFIRKNKAKESDFTRKRCLDFKTLFWFQCTNTKRSLQVETGLVAQRFHESVNEFSPQAFSKARLKMKPEAIYTIFRDATRSICQNAADKTYRGYRILAVDGTKMLLPDTPATRQEFGTGGNHLKTSAMAGASILYDILNDIVLDADIVPVVEPERNTLQHLLNRTGTEYTGENRLILLDRGYPSREMFHYLQDSGYKYIIRMTNAYNTPRCIRETTLPDSVVTDYKDNTLKHRVIKILLDSGEEELLISNLYDDTYQLSDFYELYHMRWPVETKYNEIKHKYYLEKFTGYSPCAIKQDFYMLLFLSNLTALVKQSGENERKRHNKKQNKLKYILNRNTVIGIFMQYLPQLLKVSQGRRKLLQKLIGILKTKCSAVRNNRHAERKKKQVTRTYRLNQK